MKTIFIALLSYICIFSNVSFAQSSPIKSALFDLYLTKDWYISNPLKQNRDGITLEINKRKSNEFIGIDISLNNTNAKLLALSYIQSLKNKLKDFEVTKVDNQYGMMVLHFKTETLNGAILTGESKDHSSAIIYIGNHLEHDLHEIFFDLVVNENNKRLFPKI